MTEKSTSSNTVSDAFEVSPATALLTLLIFSVSAGDGAMEFINKKKELVLKKSWY